MKGLKIQRTYDSPTAESGARFLVDRLWPRGIKQEKLHLTAWQKEVAPSEKLRKWFNHDPAKWVEFQRRYFAELKKKPEAWQPLLKAAEKGSVTLLFGAKDVEHNNAVVLKAFLEKKRDD